MPDFERKVIKDVIVETAYLTRATFKEAADLRKILADDYELRFKKVIVDISQCEFMDSTFIGVLVVALKNMSKIGSELRLVIPSTEVSALMDTVGTLKVFNTYKTLEEALAGFETY